MMPHPEPDELEREATASAVEASDLADASPGQVAEATAMPNGFASASAPNGEWTAVERATGSANAESAAKDNPAPAPRRHSGRFAPLRHSQQRTPPNEFTFGWRDVEWDHPAEGSANSGRKEDDTARRNGPGPGVRDAALPQAATSNGRLLARQMADQAARTSDRIAAGGLIAASAALALDAHEMTDPALQRVAARIVRAASWLAWRLHGHPRTRGRLVHLPQSVSLCSAALFARARRGDPPSTSHIAAMLYRQMQEPIDEDPIREEQPTSPRSPYRAPQRRRLDRSDSWTGEW